MATKKRKVSKALSVAAKAREAVKRAALAERTAKEGAAILKKLEAEKAGAQAEVTASAARPGSLMCFGDALAVLRAGGLVRRVGWNGRGMFLYLVPNSRFIVSRPPLAGIYPLGAEVYYRSHIDMVDATGCAVPWLASQTDILAGDWVAVTKEEVQR